MRHVQIFFINKQNFSLKELVICNSNKVPLIVHSFSSCGLQMLSVLRSLSQSAGTLSITGIHQLPMERGKEAMLDSCMQYGSRR